MSSNSACIFSNSHVYNIVVSWNGDTPKSSILIRLSTINQPFWGTPHLWKPTYGDVNNAFHVDTEFVTGAPLLIFRQKEVHTAEKPASGVPEKTAWESGCEALNISTGMVSLFNKCVYEHCLASLVFGIWKCVIPVTAWGQIWPQCWHCWHWTAPIAFDCFPRVEKTWKKCRWDVSVFSKCVLVKCRLKTYLQKIPRDIGPKFVWTVGINSLPVLLVKFIGFVHIHSFRSAYFRGNHTFWRTGITV